jgi:hypothetical protein
MRAVSDKHVAIGNQSCNRVLSKDEYKIYQLVTTLEIILGESLE